MTDYQTGPLLRRSEVERETGLSRPTIYRLMSTGQFPRPRRIGVRAVAWPSSEIEAWKDARPRTEKQSGGTEGGTDTVVHSIIGSFTGRN